MHDFDKIMSIRNYYAPSFFQVIFIFATPPFACFSFFFLYIFFSFSYQNGQSGCSLLILAKFLSSSNMQAVFFLLFFIFYFLTKMDRMVFIQTDFFYFIFCFFFSFFFFYFPINLSIRVALCLFLRSSCQVQLKQVKQASKQA